MKISKEEEHYGNTIIKIFTSFFPFFLFLVTQASAQLIIEPLPGEDDVNIVPNLSRPVPKSTSQPVLNDSCPQWIKERENMPACPRPGMPSIIPETYPVSAVVVSSDGLYNGGPNAEEFTQSFVEQVIRSSKADSMPLVLLMGVSEAQTAGIKEHIKELNISQALKDKAIAALRPIPHVPKFNWQQDYFESK